MIYHITTRRKWNEAIRKGSYQADTLLSEGFIHCSDLHQLTHVANERFSENEDLIILFITEESVQHEIRYENLEGGSELFPHIYGPLSTTAVIQVANFPPSKDGTFILPPETSTLL
jgi:uncharacterized protein (DUF952 family)